MSLKCYYHPEREAATKCEICEKVICVECKKPYTVTHGVSESRYATQHDACMPCYYDREIERHQAALSSKGNYICLGILGGGVVTFLILAITLPQPITWAPPILNILFLIFTIIFSIIFLFFLRSFLKGRKTFPGVIAGLKGKKEGFLKSLEIGGVCPGCGNKIEVGISICPSCGSNVGG